MPILDFKCNKCGKEHKDKVVSFSIADSGYECDNVENDVKCDGTMEKSKVITSSSTFIFKGKLRY
jgi:predicted nucleic acid-binding Zn ribbon protein